MGGGGENTLLVQTRFLEATRDVYFVQTMFKRREAGGVGVSHASIVVFFGFPHTPCSERHVKHKT